MPSKPAPVKAQHFAIIGAGMAGMQGAVVDDVEGQRGKALQAGADGVRHAHGRTFLKGLTTVRANTPSST